MKALSDGVLPCLPVVVKLEDCPAFERTDGRVAEGARLESVYTARYPGFESLPVRHNLLESMVSTF